MVSNSVSAGESADPLLPSDSEAGTRYETEYPTIGYGTVRPRERVAELQMALDRGERVLEFDSDNGYLLAVLDALDIDTSSQLLVFSRTSVNKTVNARYVRRANANGSRPNGRWVNSVSGE